MLRTSYSGRYVHFTDGAIKVDVARYLKSPEGKAALIRIENSLKRFERRPHMRGNDGALYPYCDMYGVEVVDGCATYDSLDRLYSTVPDSFARLLERALVGARHDDDGIVVEDVEYALKQSHEGRIRLYD